MDLSKAFDMISHDLLFAKLAAFGISPPDLALLHSYLRDRSQRVRIEDVTSDVIVISKGVPQGSVLGPSLLSNNADGNQIFLVITILRW